MSRASVVYLGMVGVFVAGLWAVLAVGARLRAPADLAGRWVAVNPDDGPSGHAWPAVAVEQSGQYFELAFEGGPVVGVSVVGVSVHAGHPDAGLALARGPWHVTIGPPDAAGTRAFGVDGPTSGTLVARREPAKPAAH